MFGSPSLKFPLVKVIRIYRAPLDRLSRFHSSLFLRAFIIPYLCQTRELIGRRELRETIETGEIIAVLQMIRKNYGIKRFNEFTFESIPQKIVSFPLEKGKKKKKNSTPLIPRIIDTAHPWCTTRKSGLWRQADQIFETSYTIAASIWNVLRNKLELTNDNDQRKQQGWPSTCDNNRKLVTSLDNFSV